MRLLVLAAVLVLSACSGDSSDKRIGDAAIAALIADAGTEEAFNDRLCEFRKRLWDEIDATTRRQVDDEMIERLTTDPANRTVVAWLKRLADHCVY